MKLSLSERISELSRPEHQQSVTGIRRGIEREALRITSEGRLATTMHPTSLGSTLTHSLITTDYAESLLEFITPVALSVSESLAQLRDLHRFTYRQIGEELLWTLSMPCYVNQASDIRLAYFGESHIGKMKTTYRQGLTYRYGAVMQTIAGVHFNFSVPDALWQRLAAQDGVENTQDYRSEKYFGLIRNYKRLAWVVPYLFGASPLLCPSFLKHSDTELELEQREDGYMWRPYATCLRMSDLGYTNREQADLQITYNSPQEYINGLRRAVSTPSKRFAKIGVKVDDQYNQLNANILQIENEFYSHIRPKRVAESGETPTQALERGGVQYIEIRALDVNPFSPVGISEEQMHFMDLLLMHCLLTPSPELSWDCQQKADANVNKIVLGGRKPDLSFTDEFGEKSVKERLSDLFAELSDIALLLDSTHQVKAWSHALDTIHPAVLDPDATLSAQLVRAYDEAHEQGESLGMILAAQYRRELLGSNYEFFSEAMLKEAASQSLKEQQKVESADTGTFDEFLENYFLRALDKKNAPVEAR